jgi:hypothetical protein
MSKIYLKTTKEKRRRTYLSKVAAANQLILLDENGKNSRWFSGVAEK